MSEVRKIKKKPLSVISTLIYCIQNLFLPSKLFIYLYIIYAYYISSIFMFLGQVNRVCVVKPNWVVFKGFCWGKPTNRRGSADNAYLTLMAKGCKGFRRNVQFLFSLFSYITHNRRKFTWSESHIWFLESDSAAQSYFSYCNLKASKHIPPCVERVTWAQNTHDMSVQVTPLFGRVLHPDREHKPFRQ